MDWLPEVVSFVQNIGIPGFLVVGGGIWFARVAWPDIVMLIRLYADALSNVAHALERVAEKLPPPSA